MKTTLYDIAENLGISVSTVSQVLNGRGRIADDTRKKVLEKVKDLGYRKNASKVTSRRHTAIPVAALVNTDREWNFLWNFERTLLNHIEDNLLYHGYSLLLIPLRRTNTTKEILEKITASGASAVFPMHYGNDELFEHLHRMGIPLVVVFNNRFSNRFPVISADDYRMVSDAVTLFAGMGHTSYLYADCAMDGLESTLQDRYFGFTSALERLGGGKKDFYYSRFSFDRYNHYELREKLGSFFSNGKNSTPYPPIRPTSVITVDDDAALRVFSVLGELELRVPEDLSLLAPGDVLDYSLPYTPPISTMQIDLESAGFYAAERMIESLGSGSPEGAVKEASGRGISTVKISYRYVDRGSCGPPEKKGPASSTKRNSTKRREV